MLHAEPIVVSLICSLNLCLILVVFMENGCEHTKMLAVSREKRFFGGRVSVGRDRWVSTITNLEEI